MRISHGRRTVWAKILRVMQFYLRAAITTRPLIAFFIFLQLVCSSMDGFYIYLTITIDLHRVVVSDETKKKWGLGLFHITKSGQRLVFDLDLYLRILEEGYWIDSMIEK